MPKLGYDIEAGATTTPFAICTPPPSPTVRGRWTSAAKHGAPASALQEQGANRLTIELGQASFNRLARLEAILQEMSDRLTQLQEQQVVMVGTLAGLRDMVNQQRTIKDWYSPEEVADMLEKRPYTVREWCRWGRINARKRPTGRGDAKEWEISHAELERIKSHGLLPIPAKY